MSFGRELKKIVGAVAPTLGAALGGPFGGIAMKFLADKFTGGDTGQVEDFLLSADPGQLKDLKIAEMEFRAEMKELGIKEYELDVRDRESARHLAMERGIYAQLLLSAGYTVGYFGVLFVFIFGHAEVAAELNGMINTLIGALGAAQLQILNFWFGSSKGSKDKTMAMADAAANGKSV